MNISCIVPPCAAGALFIIVAPDLKLSLVNHWQIGGYTV